MTHHAAPERADGDRAAGQTYRRVIETATDGFWVVSDEGRILDVNDAYVLRSGYTREELLEMRVSDLDAIESAEAVEARRRKIERDGRDLFETVHRAKDGTLWSAEVSVSYADGRYFAFIRDVDRRLRSEALLRTRLDLMERARSGTIDALLVHALDAAEQMTGSEIGFFHFVNQDQRTLSLQSWSTNTTATRCGADARGRHYPLDRAGVWTDCIRTREPVVHNDYAALPHKRGLPEGHAPVLRELTVPVLRDGNVVAIMGVGNKPHPYAPEDTQVVQTVASMVMDLVFGRLAEKDLRESEQRYRTLVENLDEVVFSTDRDGLFSFVSTAARRFGHDAEGMLGRAFASFVPDDDAAPVREVAAEALAGRAGSLEHRLLDSSGNPRFVRTSMRPLSRGSLVIGVTGVILDRSYQVETEERLRLSQKMQAVGQLAAGVAHDFNNLLCVIGSCAELANRRLEQQSPARAELDEILDAARRATVLTRQLLAFGRKQVLRPELVDLDALIARMESMLRRLIGEDIELDFRPHAAREWVEVDQGQLELVMVNLIVNARDAMPHGGRITIETSSDGSAPLDARYPRGSVRITVADDGTGMAPQTLERAFEPFFTTKGVGRGTGLGLSTVYGIVEQSGGHIAVESALGIGTRVAIFLPRAEGAVARPVSSSPLRIVGGHETILVVEDEQAVRGVIRRTLSGVGYEVLTAESGREALAICEYRAVDLLLTDVVMPVMSGPVMAARFRQIHPSAKVIFMSGYPDDELTRHGLTTEDLQIIGKPFEIETLIARVRSVLDGA